MKGTPSGRRCLCGICENGYLPSACPTCINSRLMNKYKLLQKLSRWRDNLHVQVEARLKAKHEANQQHHWRVLYQDRISQIKENLHHLENEFQKRREELLEKKRAFSAQADQLALASEQLTEQMDKLGPHQPELTHSLGSHLTSLTSDLHQTRRYIFRQLCKMFPLKFMSSPNVSSYRDHSSSSLRWMICGVCLPAGDDPHSVSELELGASLGYLLQLLHLVSRYLCAPVLHAARIKGSTSKIWERSSYWDGWPSKCGEYPLYTTAYPLYTTHGNALQQEQDGGSSSMMGFSTIEGTGEERLRDGGHDAKSVAGSRLMRKGEMHGEVQKAIKLLKRSVNCVFSYGFNEMLSALPSNLSTFQGLAELMIVLSLKEVKLRMGQGPQQQIDSLGDSAMSTTSSMDWKDCRSDQDFKVTIEGNSNINSIYFVGKNLDFMDCKVGDRALDEWDMVEHIPLPPPPSHSEDVEHWTRAMFLDAKK